MSAFTEKRAEVQSELTALTQTLQTQLFEAGSAIVESGLLPENEPYASLTAQVRETSARTEELQTNRERIVSAGERLAEISASTDELQKRLKKIGSDLDPHYQTIGENSFRVFRENPLIDQEYAEIFTPVLEAFEEIRQTRSELQSAEAEIAEKPFLEKMVLRGRIIVLRNRLALRETQLERLYRDAGRQIAATDFIAMIGDPKLDEAAAPFVDLMEERQRVEQEITTLNDERSTLGEELTALGVDRRPATRLNEIDNQIRAAEDERRSTMIEIAKSAIGASFLDSAGDAITSRLTAVSDTEDAREAARKRLERIDAAIRIERLSGEISQIESTADRKRAQVKSLTAEIEELERKRAGLQSEVTQAEKIRGSVKKLLE